jgi:hypothetical protein
LDKREKIVPSKVKEFFKTYLTGGQLFPVGGVIAFQVLTMYSLLK